MTEKELFDYLKMTTIENIELMEYGFSNWDCLAWYDTPVGRVDFVLELKCREAHYSEMLIEQAKYDWLIEEAGKRCSQRRRPLRTRRRSSRWSAFCRSRKRGCSDESSRKGTHLGDPRLRQGARLCADGA